MKNLNQRANSTQGLADKNSVVSEGVKIDGHIFCARSHSGRHRFPIARCCEC